LYLEATDGTDQGLIQISKNSVLIQTINDNPVTIQELQIYTTNITTTNNTVTTVFTYPVGGTNGGINVNCRIQCSNSTFTQAYIANLFAGFLYDGTSITQISTTDKVEKTTLVGATSDITFTGTDLIVTVTGLVATTIKWKINIEILS